MADASLYLPCRTAADEHPPEHEGEAHQRCAALVLDLTGCPPLCSSRAHALTERLRARRPPALAGPAAGSRASLPELRIQLDGLRWGGDDHLSALMLGSLVRDHGLGARLVELSLRSCTRLCCETLRALLCRSWACAGGQALRTLDLSGCCLLASSELGPILAASCPRLGSLDVSGLGGRSASAWAASLARALGGRLLCLRLDHARLGDEGAARLCDGLRNVQGSLGVGSLPLRELSLRDCALGNGALGALRALLEGARGCESALALRALWLCDNAAIDDDGGVAALLCAPGLSRLASLDLSGTSLGWRRQRSEAHPERGPADPPATVAGAVCAHPSLRRIAVRDCPQLGGEGAAGLAYGRQRLRELVLARGAGADGAPPPLTVQADAATLQGARPGTGSGPSGKRFSEPQPAAGSAVVPGLDSAASGPADSWEALLEAVSLPPLAESAPAPPAVSAEALEDLSRPLAHPAPRSIFFISSGPPPPRGAADGRSSQHAAGSADAGWDRLGDVRAAAAAESAKQALRQQGDHPKQQQQQPQQQSAGAVPEAGAARAVSVSAEAFYFAQRGHVRHQTGFHAGMRL